MTPTPEAWAVAARILPGGRWHAGAVKILQGAGAATKEDLDCMLSEARIFVARGWHHYDPNRGIGEWTFARHYVRAAASKRKPVKGGIHGPHWCNLYKLDPDVRAAWEALATVPLQSHARIGKDATARDTVADTVAAPPPIHDPTVTSAALQLLIARVAERSPPVKRRRLAILAEAIAIGEGCDREIAGRLNLAQQNINKMRNEGAAYLVKSLTPAERFALSMTRSPDV